MAKGYELFTHLLSKRKCLVSSALVHTLLEMTFLMLKNDKGSKELSSFLCSLSTLIYSKGLALVIILGNANLGSMMLLCIISDDE
jgi:hypothetical protein